jgi:hypothetical protein
MVARRWPQGLWSVASHPILLIIARRPHVCMRTCESVGVGPDTLVKFLLYAQKFDIVNQVSGWNRSLYWLAAVSKGCRNPDSNFLARHHVLQGLAPAWQNCSDQKNTGMSGRDGGFK